MRLATPQLSETIEAATGTPGWGAFPPKSFGWVDAALKEANLSDVPDCGPYINNCDGNSYLSKDDNIPEP
jgi:hypothetical protein